MREADPQQRRNRIAAACAAAFFHLLLGWALLIGLGYEAPRRIAEHLQVIALTEPPPPPEKPPAEKKAAKAEGAASRPNLKAKPVPVVAPKPKVRLPTPPPIRTASRPSTVVGRDASAGGSTVAGPGSGSGGVGNGSGAGGSGNGSGGGAPERAQRLSGALTNADYPKRALKAGVEGSVRVRYVVGTDGRVSGCSVLASSADAELAALTCRLIEDRFRYRPARDAQGRPVQEIVSKTFDWILPGRHGLVRP